MLLFYLLMLRMQLAPAAILLELDLLGDELLILARPIIDAVAFGAGELEKLILRHNERNYIPKRGLRSSDLLGIT